MAILRTAASAAALTLVLGACTGSGDDGPTPAGNASPAPTEEPGEPVTLRLAHPFSPLPTIDHLKSTVADLSGGSVKIREVPTDSNPEWEQLIVRGVADGEYDLGWVGTRAFAELGMTSFDALTAPFLIDSYPLMDAVLSSDIPGRMLPALDELGVTGLAIMGGGLRKPFAVQAPLLGPEDYVGITFRTFQSSGHAQAITTLGADHLGYVSSVDSAITDGTIDAIENTLLWYQPLDARQTPYVTANVNLWPQTAVLVVNPDVLAGLTDAQAGALREAVADTAARSVALSDIDAERVELICEWGGRFAEATSDDLTALREAVQPEYDRLAEDPDTATFIGEIEALKSSVTTEPLAIPDGCSGEATGVIAEGADDPGVLNGTYRLEWTVDELTALGVPQDAIDEFGMAGVFTWVLTDGQLRFTAELTGGDDYACDGTYGVTGATVDLLRNLPCPAWHWTAGWELTDDALVLSGTTHEGGFEPLVETWLAAKPWPKND